MILIILGIPITLFGLFIALINLSKRQRASGREVISPAVAGEAKDVSVVGIARPIAATGESPVLGDEVLWVRAFKTYQGLFRSSSGSSSNVRRIGKFDSQFALTDESDPGKSIIINSKKISEIWIQVAMRRYSLGGEPLFAEDSDLNNPITTIMNFLKFHLIEKEGMEERAIRPGDRIWAHGRIREINGVLTLGGFSAWLDDLDPAERVRNATAFARFGGMVSAAGLLMMFIGWLIS
ncbi:MAG: hypothetical protein JJU37_06120 [Balneolaceae bacterium]|nr:hypothetical protein [Balneolaceae bacterium]